MLEMAGIYRIAVDRGDSGRKFYIGQAANFKRRRKDHFVRLRRGDHKNQPLQRAFAKYGEAAFSFEIAIVCERRKEILDLYEQAVLDSCADDEIYNLNRLCVGSRLGVKSRLETKAKIGAGNRGKGRSPEHREAVGRSNRERIVSRETRAKMSATRVGKKFPGRVLTDEHKKHVGDSFRGKKRPPELMARIVAARRANAEARGYY